MESQRSSWNYRRQIVKFLETTKNKTYTIIGLTFLALILFGAFAIRPTIGTIFKLQKKIDSGKEIEKNMQEKLDTLNELQGFMTSYTEEVDLLKGSLLTEVQLDSVIANTELIAEKYDLEVLGLSPNEDSEILLIDEMETGLSYKELNIRLEGTEQNFQKFINHLENLPQKIYVNSLGYTTLDEEELKQLSINIYIFYISE